VLSTAPLYNYEDAPPRQTQTTTDDGDVNGYAFDGATRFMFVDFRDAVRTLWR
jgi:hypothetical protein